jgi:hypothetical protein
VDVALQKAKLEFFNAATKEKKLPCYWAATVLTGNSNAIIIPKPAPWKWIAGIVILFLLSIGGFILRTRNNHLPVLREWVKPGFKR